MSQEDPDDYAKEFFFQHISHDIRGAYFGVGSICAIIFEKVASGEEVSLPLAQSLLEASRHYKYLLDQFLDFSRSKIAAVGAVEKEAFDPVEEIRQIVELNRYLAQEKGIAVDMQVDAGFPQVIRTDKWKTLRIFYNVFVNALKFSPRDSHIEVGLGIEAAHWVLRVADQGAGIEPQLLERLFRSPGTERLSPSPKMERLSPSPKMERLSPSPGADRPIDDPESAGLGLLITGYLTRLLGGVVTVESSAGAGMVISFRFPFLPEEPAKS